MKKILKSLKNIYRAVVEYVMGAFPPPGYAEVLMAEVRRQQPFPTIKADFWGDRYGTTEALTKAQDAEHAARVSQDARDLLHGTPLTNHINVVSSGSKYPTLSPAAEAFVEKIRKGGDIVGANAAADKASRAQVARPAAKKVATKRVKKPITVDTFDASAILGLTASTFRAYRSKGILNIDSIRTDNGVVFALAQVKAEAKRRARV